MIKGIRHSHIIAIQLLAFWPVMNWYFLRMTDSSDEPWGVVALITAIGFVLLKNKKNEVSNTCLLSSLFFLILYLTSYTVLPPLGRAVLAVVSIACTLSSACLGKSMHIGIMGLLLLSLPIIASLQFYVGYPVRWVTTIIVAKLITLTGFDVSASGTCLFWAGEIVSIDAPCAGIRMLWSGLYLNFTLATLTGIGSLNTWIAYSLSVIIIFTSNVFRAMALFFVETRIFEGPGWLHNFIGLVAFLIIAISIVTLHFYMRRRETNEG